MKNIFVLLTVVLLYGCTAETKQPAEKPNNSSVDTAKTAEAPPPSMEQLYSEKLSGPCSCDLMTNFELSGEGEVFPLVVTVNGEDREYSVSAAHVTGWDGKEYFSIDSLEDGTIFKDSLAKVHNQVLKNTWLKGGPVYAWPDEKSEQLYRLKSDSYWGWDRCYGTWVRVNQWDSNKKEYRYGWVKKP